MISKETVLFYADNREDKLFLSGIYDNYRKTSARGIATYSSFMSERKQQLVISAFSSDKNIGIEFFGGYPGAERKILCFYEEEKGEYPISVIKAETSSGADLSHRHYLGALMGLGIERDRVGDIAGTDGVRYIYVLSEIADYILMNYEKAGRERLKCELFCGDAQIASPEPEIASFSVASLRLDAVIAAAFRLSRDKAKQLIESGRVCVDGREKTNVDFVLKEGSAITARGFGKAGLLGIKGTSKKGRTFVEMEILR